MCSSKTCFSSYIFLMNDIPTHSQKLEIWVIQVPSYSSTITFTLKIFFFHFLSPSLQLILTQFDHLFLDVYVINSLTSCYPCLFPNFHFFWCKLFFQLQKSSYLIVKRQLNPKISAWLIGLTTWSIKSHQSFFLAYFLFYQL